MGVPIACCEDQVVVGPQLASVVAHLGLLLSVFEQHHTSDLGQGDHSVGGIRLRLINKQLAGYPLYRLGNFQGVLCEIDIAPSEPEQLAPAKAERRSEYVHRVETGSLGRREESLDIADG